MCNSIIKNLLNTKFRPICLIKLKQFKIQLLLHQILHALKQQLFQKIRRKK